MQDIKYYMASAVIFFLISCGGGDSFQVEIRNAINQSDQIECTSRYAEVQQRINSRDLNSKKALINELLSCTVDSTRVSRDLIGGAVNFYKNKASIYKLGLLSGGYYDYSDRRFYYVDAKKSPILMELFPD